MLFMISRVERLLDSDICKLISDGSTVCSGHAAAIEFLNELKPAGPDK